MLDLKLDQAKTLSGKVCQEDQRRLAEYLETIRALETRIEADIARAASGENLDPSVKPEVDKLHDRISTFEKGKDSGGQMRHDHTEHARLMLDLIAMAFWSDHTRADTFMFGSSLRNGNAHKWKNLSLILAGRGGNLNPSGHITSAKDTPLFNLYLNLLQRSGLNLDHFCDSTGSLDGLG